MTQELSDKIFNLQKNFIELNNLFELNILSNQAYSLEDLLNKISFFHQKTAIYLFFICFGAILNVPVIFMLQGFVGLKQP